MKCQIRVPQLTTSGYNLTQSTLPGVRCLRKFIQSLSVLAIYRQLLEVSHGKYKILKNFKPKIRRCPKIGAVPPKPQVMLLFCEVLRHFAAGHFISGHFATGCLVTKLFVTRTIFYYSLNC